MTYLLLLLACADKDSTDDTAATSDDTAVPSDDTAVSSDDTGAVDDTQDSGQTDAAPVLSADLTRVAGAVGSNLVVQLTIEDEDPGSVTLAAEGSSGTLDGLAWTADTGASTQGTVTFTATDAGGQSATLALDVHVYLSLSWTGVQPYWEARDLTPGREVAQGPGGEVALVGYAGNSDYWGFALDAAGQEAWTVSAAGKRVNALWSEAAGCYLLTGWSWGGPSALDCANPDLQWSTGETNLAGAELAVGDGEIFDVGRDVTGGQGAWIRRVDPATGATAGDRVAIYPGSPMLTPNSVDRLADGGALVSMWGRLDPSTGESSSQFQGWLVVVDLDQGTHELVATPRPPNQTTIWDAIELSDGRIALCGQVIGHAVENAGQSFLTVLGTDGAEDWTLISGQDANNHWSRIVEGSDGTLYVTGTERDNAWTAGDLVVAAVTPQGAETWSTRVQGDGLVQGRGLALVGDSLVVGGMTSGDLTTVPSTSPHANTWAFMVRMDLDGVIQ